MEASPNNFSSFECTSLSPIFISSTIGTTFSSKGSGLSSNLFKLSSIPIRYLAQPANTRGISFKSDTFKFSLFSYAFIVSPNLIASFCDVSQAILCGVSGINGFGSLTSTTVSMNSLGLMIPGSVTTGSPSLYPIVFISFVSSLSFISSLIFSYPKRQPYIASAV